MNLVKTIGLAVILGGSSLANAYMVDDNYVGGDDHGYGDVIGKKSWYDTHGLDVHISGTQVTVDIFTNFGSAGSVGSYAGLTRNDRGIGFGDLFLSSSWDPYGSAPYADDNSSKGTTWTYGVSVNGRYAQNPGERVATLYKLDSDDIRNSDFWMTGGVYRNGQEVTVKRNTAEEVSSASWSFGDGKVSFVFDAAGTDLLSGDELALHWAMLCGNDVIEGSVPVSVNEPGSIALLGLGLFGLGFLRRKTK